MPKKLMILTTLLLQAVRLHAADIQSTEAASMDAKSPLEITFQHTAARGHLDVRYKVVNRSDKAIFLFDRLWDREAEKLDANWAYVAIAGKEAVLRRGLELLPRGVHVEAPLEPYGRQIEPGATASGSFKLPLPLTEGGPYDRMTGRKPSKTVLIEKIALELGWCPKSDLENGLDKMEPVKLDGETLWLFVYGQLRAIQKKAKSASLPAQLRARALSPR